MSQHQEEIAAPIFKAATLWGAIGITSWAEAASFAAFLYSMVLLSEWLWKKLIKPFCISRGWLRGR